MTEFLHLPGPVGLSALAWGAIFAVALIAGLVKGMVGFAMPMIMISGLGSFVGPDWALAGLILPTLATNGWQALRQGPGAAWQVVKRFRVFLGVAFVMLMLSAQLVRVLPQQVILLMIGGPIVLFALTQLTGRALTLAQPPKRGVELAVASFAGFIGGFSGVWGPPTVAYLTALDTPKTEQVRVQGVIYGLGAVALLGAHFGSGVLRAETLPFSVVMVPVALAGMALGFRLQDRIDQATFRRATLVVLLVAGLNLLRRALLS
ncbi:sulfite exporter TauE/SafE family protein [Oceanicola sp. S124]|uniref:sulfite exporter TauE/SafE family protein n=1 Tax=Oceanicola sp. S124 TaxID=1042378 RepID=UPI00025589AD|nr:sulfite exporter TauE/SafE family protein [Oceanicola sp. S124]